MSDNKLIDVHAHFYTAKSGRGDWRTVNEARITAGDQMGITAHVASILGTWGAVLPRIFRRRTTSAMATRRCSS